MDSESCMRVLLVQSFIFVERVIAYTCIYITSVFQRNGRSSATARAANKRHLQSQDKAYKATLGHEVQLLQIQMQNMRARRHIQPIAQ